MAIFMKTFCARLCPVSLLHLALGEGNDPMAEWSWASGGPVHLEVAKAAAAVYPLAGGSKDLVLSAEAAKLLADSLRDAANMLDDMLEQRGRVTGHDRVLWRRDRDAMHRDADRIFRALDG